MSEQRGAEAEVAEAGRRPLPSSENARRTMKANRSTSRLEIRFRRRLWAAGLRYRLRSALPGRPDLVFPGRRTVLFVHGCFWHTCPTCELPRPKANADFWSRKLADNVRRDAAVQGELVARGWTVHVIWEHDLRRDLDQVVGRICRDLLGLPDG